VTTPFWKLDPGIAYLNHGSFGSCPAPVLEAQAALRGRMEREPVDFLSRGLEAMLDAARAAVAAFVGADAGGLVFVPNATHAVNAVLASVELRPGDVLLTTDHAYPACRNALHRWASRAGARVEVARLPFPLAGPEEVERAVLAGVGPRTRLCLLDHVTSPTALVLPVERLVPALRERGVETLVDGAHAPGMLPLDLRRLGAAYYAANLHKWVCAPKGAGFLHVREDLREAVQPAITSHGRTATRPDRSRFLLEFDWTGTGDPTAVLCAPVAIEAVAALAPGGWEQVRRENHALACQGRDLLCAALGVAPPAPDAMLGSMAALPLPDAAGQAPRSAFDPDPLHGALRAEGIEVPVFPWPTWPRRLLRISAQRYNRLEEYRRLAGALRRLLA
jgi:isopenicillin-N epimerase